MLAENQSELSSKFADHDEVDVHRFVGVDHRVGDLGVPLLDGAVAELECAVPRQPRLRRSHGVRWQGDVGKGPRPTSFRWSSIDRVT